MNYYPGLTSAVKKALLDWLSDVGLTPVQAVIVFGLFAFGIMAKLGQNNNLQPHADDGSDHDD